MAAESLPEIYYLTIRVAYKKGKSVINKETWAVSRYTTPSDIMSKDSKTMDRLKSSLYSKAYKGQRHVMIREVMTSKVVGRINRIAL